MEEEDELISDEEDKGYLNRLHQADLHPYEDELLCIRN